VEKEPPLQEERKRVCELLRKLERAVHALDYRDAGDIGEDTARERIEEALKDI
jgi:hypothetical protein